MRFQVCLPTPMSVIYAFCTARDVAAIETAYEKAMIARSRGDVPAIPHSRSLHPVGCLPRHDHLGRSAAGPVPAGERLQGGNHRAHRAASAAAVPVDVELGFHLCYGDFGGKHFFDPVTARHLVDIANAIAQARPAQVAYIHLPVPRRAHR